MRKGVLLSIRPHHPPASSEPAQAVTFGLFRFDLRTLELTKSGRAVPLTPQPARVLAALLTPPGRLCTREELVESAWGASTHLDAEAGLNTAIRRIRRALGDSATAPRFLETVPRRGYRFIAPVEPRDATAPPAERRSARPRPGWRTGLSVGAFAVLAAVAWMRTDIEGTAPVAEPEAEAFAPQATGPTEVVLEVETPESGGRDLRMAAHGLADQVRLRFADHPSVRLIAAEEWTGRGDPDRLLFRVEPGERPDQAFIDVRWLEGTTRSADARLLGEGLPILATGVALDHFVSVREDVARLIANRFEVTLAPTVAKHGPVDPEAWKLFLEALALLEKGGCPTAGAVSLLQQSLLRDQGFASAWYVLAGAQLLDANLCSSRPVEASTALEAAEKASALAPAWPDPVQLRAGILVQAGRVEEAMELLNEAAPRFPESPWMELRRSEVLRYAGDLEQAREVFSRVLEANPAAVLQADTVAYPYAYLADWPQFLDLLPARQGPFYRFYRGLALARMGEVGAARQALSEGIREPGGNAFGSLSQALLAILEGREEEARLTLEQLARRRAANGVGDGEMTFKLGQLMTWAGDRSRGAELLELAVEQGFFCAECLEGGGLAESLAGEPAYERLLESASERGRAFRRRFG